MAKDSVQVPGFILKPGGIMEEGLATDLPPDQYSEVSGITESGALRKMPGKVLVKKFNDRVLQVANFGGAVVVQHGSTVELFPDACALTPDYVGDSVPPGDGGGGGDPHQFIIDYPNSHQITMGSAVLRRMNLYRNEGDPDIGRVTLLGVFERSDFFDNPDTTPPTGKKEIDVTGYLLPYIDDPSNHFSLVLEYDEYTTEELTYNRSYSTTDVTPTGTSHVGGSSVTIGYFWFDSTCAVAKVRFTVFVPRPD